MEMEDDTSQRKKTLSKKDTNTIDSNAKRGKSNATSVATGDGKLDMMHDIPKSCQIGMLKLNRIEKLDEDFVLVAHPFP